MTRGVSFFRLSALVSFVLGGGTILNGTPICDMNVFMSSTCDCISSSDSPSSSTGLGALWEVGECGRLGGLNLYMVSSAAGEGAALWSPYSFSKVRVEPGSKAKRDFKSFGNMALADGVAAAI